MFSHSHLFSTMIIIRDDQCEEVNNIDEANDPSFLGKKFTWVPGTRPTFCFGHGVDIHSIHVSTCNMLFLRQKRKCNALDIMKKLLEFNWNYWKTKGIPPAICCFSFIR